MSRKRPFSNDTPLTRRIRVRSMPRSLLHTIEIVKHPLYNELHTVLRGTWRGRLVAEFPKRYVIPEGVTKIEKYTFQSAPLTEVVLPSTLEIIDRDAFANSNVTIINWGNTVLREIHFRAFADCAALTFTDPLPDTCKYIGINAFLNCFNIHRMYLPHGFFIKKKDPLV